MSSADKVVDVTMVHHLLSDLSLQIGFDGHVGQGVC